MNYTIKAGGASACLLALLLSSARAADDDINQAVDRGVTFLKKLQWDNGTWAYLGTEPPGRDRQETVGATALAGLTLLECGVPANDTAVLKAAARVRKACITLQHTYSLSLAIMFLDLLGDAKDQPLIQSMGVRLMAGQNYQGGWSYNCPGLNAEEQAALSRLILQRHVLIGRAGHPKAGKKESRLSEDLPKEILDELARLKNYLVLGGGRHLADNSNTQFAVLGLWVARRHNLPVDPCLEQAAARFRNSQAYDGSWSYYSATVPLPRGTPPMTCAGLIALGLAFGPNLLAALRTDSVGKVTDFAVRPNADNFVRAGLIYLANQIGHASDFRNSEEFAGDSPDYYFLWSLERVGMLYGLETIGRKDWYAWGSQVLLKNQNEKGGWQGRKFGAGADTCFALLFLKRANVARDLSAALTGKVLDPGEVKLKAGGEDGLRTRSSKPGEKPTSKKPPPAPARESAGPKPARLEKPAGHADAKPSDPGTKKPKAATPQSTPSEDPEEKEAARLATELIQAPADKQEAMIEQLKERKGLAHTEALARAIPQLTGPTKLTARDALAERLARMTAGTLHEKLRDERAEVRRAAALACAMKEDKTFVADLITLLEDPQRTVFSAAHAALKALTSKDFGPALNANPADRAVAIAKWKEWWKSQGGAK